MEEKFEGVKREFEYLKAQLGVAKTIHPEIEKSLDRLRELLSGDEFRELERRLREFFECKRKFLELKAWLEEKLTI